jgi:hypothetical protein
MASRKKFTAKDAGSALGLPVGIILTWIISKFTPAPIEIGAAIGSICSFGAAYFIKGR